MSRKQMARIEGRYADIDISDWNAGSYWQDKRDQISRERRHAYGLKYQQAHGLETGEPVHSGTAATCPGCDEIVFRTTGKRVKRYEH